MLNFCSYQWVQNYEDLPYLVLPVLILYLFLFMSLHLQIISHTIQNSVDEFVVELLVRMFEPPTADSHLARFCLASDPEPCLPHYSSHAVRATLDYLPSCYGNAAVGSSFIRLLSKKKVQLHVHP